MLKGSNINKIFVVCLPFISLFIAFHIFENYLVLPSWIIDDDLGSRNFILGIYGIGAIVIILNLIHFQIFFEHNRVKFFYQLSHRFSADRDIHELKIKNIYVCTGCFGSFLGLLLGLILLLLYLFVNVKSDSLYGILFLGIGCLSIIIGYLRYFIELEPKIRIVQHFTLFFGIFLVLLSIDINYQSFYMLLLSFPIILLFIGARLLLARINDEKIAPE